MESRSFRLEKDHSSSNTLWIKPLFNAPFGFVMWVGAMIRTIQIVPLQDYLTSVRKYTSKTYSTDFLPLKAGKNHIFAKYEFKVTDQ
jgi:hypothetical protein